MNISDEELDKFYMIRLKRILAEHYKKIIDDKNFSNGKKQEHAELIEAIMNEIKNVRQKQKEVEER